MISSGPGAVTDAPAGHRISLREAVDHDRPLASVGGYRGRRDVPAAVVDERLVDLVADDQVVVFLGKPHDVLRALRGSGPCPPGSRAC